MIQLQDAQINDEWLIPSQRLTSLPATQNLLRQPAYGEPSKAPQFAPYYDWEGAKIYGLAKKKG